MSDPMVLKTQQWLNNNYGSDSRYEVIPESGNTGWTTIYALIRALQIELGIQSTSNNFGATTESRFNLAYPNGIQQQEQGASSQSNVYGIIQGALWCKGYSVNATDITTHFYGGTGNAIQLMKTDAGMINPNSTVTLEVMKALLSMKQYKLVSGGSTTIRTIQQTLNRSYSNYIKYSPCDGVYGRDMNKALIIVLQAIERYSVTNATGNFGSGTKANLPIIPYTGTTYTSDEIEEAILLIRYSLYCNGYNVNITNTEYNSELIDKIMEFQTDMCLTVNGVSNVDTWMALMISKGNPDRSCTACDTRFEMTAERIAYLKSNGYQVVGRYLTGGNFKQLRPGEPQRIIDAGLSFFPIFQESGQNIAYFTTNNGRLDVLSAIHAAKKHGIPNNNVIYFAVDMDPTDAQIINYILPYFQSLNSAMQEQATNNKYKIGVYGTRNVCTQIMNAEYAETCFVSDMSTGFSGNMGFKMPINWNFDQFCELQVTTSSGTWDLDKVTYSSEFPVVTSLQTPSFAGHATIRSGVDSYYLGTVRGLAINQETPMYMGQYFTILNDEFQLKTKTKRNMLAIAGYRIITAMYQYGAQIALNNNEHIYTYYQSSDFEAIVGTYANVQSGVDYRTSYGLIGPEAMTLPEGFTVDIDIYISTLTEE